MTDENRRGFFLKSNSSNTSTKLVEIRCNLTDCRPLVQFTQRKFSCCLSFRLSRPNERPMTYSHGLLLREASQQQVNDNDKCAAIGRLKGLTNYCQRKCLECNMQQLENAAVNNYIETTTLQGKEMKVYSVRTTSMDCGVCSRHYDTLNP